MLIQLMPKLSFAWCNSRTCAAAYIKVVFKHYAGTTGSDMNTLSLNQWTLFCTEQDVIGGAARHTATLGLVPCQLFVQDSVF
eukprot:SAG11_NODE_2614_length_3170_cov_2.584500_3_plen_82_part_00